MALDARQELSDHITPFDPLVHILDGEAEIRVAGESYKLRTGETIIMPANETHAVKANKRFKMLLATIRT